MTGNSSVPNSAGSDTPGSLIDFRRVEMGLASDMKRLKDISTRAHLEPTSIQLIDDALMRQEIHKFSIGVVGEFKRGKSTFINALLRREILPADVLPCSATINRVIYGLRPSVKIIYKGENGKDGQVDEIEIDQLANYVTKLTPESEINASKIKEAVITYPSPYCSNNVEIIDTPGLNDDETMTSVTLGVLPSVSAAILVIMAQSPFSQYEADFLNNKLLLQDLGRVIFVVTGVDMIQRPEDRERIIDVIRKRIEASIERRLVERFGSKEDENYKFYRRQIGVPRVFGLSGYQALEGYRLNNASLIEQSGMQGFEHELERFLIDTKGAIELQVLTNRIIATSDEINAKLNIELGSLDMGKEEFETKYQSAIQELENLRQQRHTEIEKINRANEQTIKRLQPIVASLEDELKDAACIVVDDFPMQPDDLNKENMDALTQKVGKQVHEAVRNQSVRISEGIQIQIEQDIVAELNRLDDFSTSVSRVLRDIELSFGPSDLAVYEDKQMTKSAISMIVGGLGGTVAGGVISGYYEAGGKGAAVGALAGLGTALAGGVVMAALSLPFTWPAFIVLGIASTFAGKWLTKWAFKGDQVEKFKSQYKQTILSQIEKQLKTQNLENTINNHVNQSYGALKNKLLGEVDALINQTQSTLDTLRAERARGEAEVSLKRKENEEIRLEVQGIRSKAYSLSHQLIEITNI